MRAERAFKTKEHEESMRDGSHRILKRATLANKLMVVLVVVRENEESGGT